jgi:hypothetical protein
MKEKRQSEAIATSLLAGWPDFNATVRLVPAGGSRLLSATGRLRPYAAVLWLFQQ